MLICRRLRRPSIIHVFNAYSFPDQGTIDANVMGGISKYQQAFFTSHFVQNESQMLPYVHQLNALILDQVGREDNTRSRTEDQRRSDPGEGFNCAKLSVRTGGRIGDWISGTRSASSARCATVASKIGRTNYPVKARTEKTRDTDSEVNPQLVSLVCSVRRRVL